MLVDALARPRTKGVTDVRPLRLVGNALMTALALSFIVSSTALAENPMILPEPTVKNPLKFSSEGGKSRFVLELFSSFVVECLKTTSTGEFTSADLGTISVDFKECKNNKGLSSCHSEGDEKGTILLDKEDVHLVAFLKGTELALGLVIELLPNGGKNLKVICNFNLELVGKVLGLVDGIKSLLKTKSMSVLFHRKEGKQEFTSCELSKKYCEENKSIKLEESIGMGFEPVDLEAESTITFEKELEIHF